MKIHYLVIRILAILALGCGSETSNNPSGVDGTQPADSMPEKANARSAEGQEAESQSRAPVASEEDLVKLIETDPPPGVVVHSDTEKSWASFYRKLLLAFREGGTGFQTKDLFADGVIVGPVLWRSLGTDERIASLRVDAPHSGARSVPGVLCVPRKPSPLCEFLRTYEVGDTDEEILKAAKRRPGLIVLEGRMLMGERRALLAEMLQDRFGPFGDCRLSGLTDRDYALYWALIPYDIARPIAILQAGGRRFLLDFDEAGQVKWIDDHTEWGRRK